MFLCKSNIFSKSIFISVLSRPNITPCELPVFFTKRHRTIIYSIEFLEIT
jgi:hypothetical protein